MFRDRLYSGIITWLKIVLPLGALAILSSLVYLARGTEDRRQIPFVEVAGDLYERERVESPEYLSQTGDGSALRITAREVVPDPDRPEVYLADAVTGRLETRKGRIIQATSPEGLFDIDGNVADLIGIVSIDTSDGYHVLTETLHTRLDITFVESGGPIRGEGPLGRIEAGLMRYGDKKFESDLLRFTGGVKVVYQPDD